MPETIFRGINDSIRITGDSQLTVTAGKDGIHAENDEDTSLGFVYISNGMIAVEAAKTEQKNLRNSLLFLQKIFPQKANPQKVSHAGIILFCNYPQQSGDCFRRKLYPYGGNRFRGSGGRLNRYTSPIPRCLHRGIGPLRQLPNGHASMSAWVVACRNKNRTVVVLFGLCQKIRRLFL